MQISSSNTTCLADRTVSSFPLSIGTGMAFDALFDAKIAPYDSERPLPERVNVGNYSDIYINIATLYRNMIGAINKDIFINSIPKEFKEALELEIEVIQSLFKIEGGDQCVPVFYHCTYDKLISQYSKKNILFRQDKTEYQHIVKDKMNKAFALLMKDNINIVKYDTDITNLIKTTSLILSHVPYDLVSYKHFLKLDLLESHTGKVKSRYKWNTKYADVGDADLSHLPFTKKLLLMFGDKVLIQPGPMKLRKLLYDISINRRWTPMTTEDKIRIDLNIDVKESYVLQFINAL